MPHTTEHQTVLIPKKGIKAKILIWNSQSEIIVKFHSIFSFLNFAIYLTGIKYCNVSTRPFMW